MWHIPDIKKYLQFFRPLRYILLVLFHYSDGKKKRDASSTTTGSDIVKQQKKTQVHRGHKAETAVCAILTGELSSENQIVQSFEN